MTSPSIHLRKFDTVPADAEICRAAGELAGASGRFRLPFGSKRAARKALGRLGWPDGRSTRPDPESEPELAKESAAPEAKEPLGKLLLINLHMFLRVTIGCSNMASEPVHAVALCGGDVAAVRV